MWNFTLLFVIMWQLELGSIQKTTDDSQPLEVWRTGVQAEVCVQTCLCSACKGRVLTILACCMDGD